MPSEDTLFVETQGCAVRVQSLDEDVIKGLVSVRGSQGHIDSNGAVGLHESCVAYPCKLVDESLAMTLGAWERLEPQLKRLGWKIRYQDNPRLETSEWDWPEKPRFDSSHADGGHGELLRAIRDHRCGRAEVAERDIPPLLVDLCRLYAGYRILLVVNRRHLFKPIKEYFEGHFAEKFDVLSESRYPREPYRVAVTCVAGLRHYVSRWQHDMVVLVDLEHMLSVPFMTSPTFAGCYEGAGLVAGELIQFYTQIDRVYGFTPVGYTVADCDLLTLDHLSGPLRYTPRSRKQTQVLLLPTRSGRTRACNSAYLKRAANYWDNRQRNQQIADLAKLLLQGDSQPGKRTNRQRIPCEQLRRHPGGATAVLVENLTHANQLAKLLPGWCVVHVETDGPKPLNSSEHGGLIVTVARFAQSCPEVENLLVASGEIPHGHLSPEQFHSFNLVVDFLDHFDADAMHEAEERQRTYRARHAIVLTHPD